MVWSTAGRDDVVLDAGLAIEPRSRATPTPHGARLRMQVAVIGAGVIGVTTAYGSPPTATR